MLGADGVIGGPARGRSALEWARRRSTARVPHAQHAGACVRLHRKAQRRRSDETAPMHAPRFVQGGSPFRHESVATEMGCCSHRGPEWIPRFSEPLPKVLQRKAQALPQRRRCARPVGQQLHHSARVGAQRIAPPPHQASCEVPGFGTEGVAHEPASQSCVVRSREWLETHPSFPKSCRGRVVRRLPAAAYFLNVVPTWPTASCPIGAYHTA